jgi:PAS domain S-box-containing protein
LREPKALHSVQFYDDETMLIDAVARLATTGFGRGDAVFIIATPTHVEALRQRLTQAGFDPDALALDGRYVELDAAATLARIAAGDAPDDVAFDQCIAQPIARAAARYGRVSAFGEMVALLCADGRQEAALRLEQLWCGLCARVPLDLLCAYPLDQFAAHGGERLFDDVCAAHTDVVPDEEYLGLDEPGRLRLVARLRRHAQALEREVALRRTLQLELAQREHELTDFIENGAEPLHKLGADGTILWANKAELEFLGYAEHEYVGRNVTEFHVDPQVARSCLGDLLAGRPVRDVPAKLRHKDGSIRHVLLSSNAFRLEGRFVYGRCFSRDVTAHVLTEQRLREELDAWEVLRRTGVALNSELDDERLVQTVVDAAVELTHARYGVLLYNEASASEAGTPHWQRASAGAVDEAPGDFPLPLSSEILAPTLHGERVQRYDDLGWRPAGGSGEPIRSYLAAPLISRSGEIHGGVFLAHPHPCVFSRRDELVVEGIAAQAAIAIDNARLFQANERAREEQRAFNETLERRIVERTEALYRSEQQLDQLLSGIADYAIFLLDAEGRVLTWNTGAERIKGYAAREIIGRSFAQFYTPEDRAAGMPQRALATARAQGKFEAEAWRVRKDGSRFWANVLLDAIHNRDGEVVGFAKVTRDMTEKRAMEEQLHQSQRMEAVGRMTGGVAHDFNNLLTIIIGNLDAICREPSLKPKVRTAAEHALRGAQRATALTQQLLAFSRRQALNPRPTDINRLVAGTAELLKRTFGESIAIATELSADLGASEVDAPQLESALINLAMNARDAMPTGGRLTIATANVHVGREEIGTGVAIGDYVAIDVTDTGVGMNADVREHAFEPFFTTKPPGRGTGLGLSQVYGFVKQSGGLVKLRSEPGRGTTVTICLPRLHAEGQDAEAPVQDETPVGSGTILLVEDNEDVRRYSAGMLRELGFSVIEAADGESALDLLEQHPEVRLLFTDVGLPGIDGPELAERARRRRADLKVLFTTGYAHHSLALSSRVGENTGLLKKPYMRAQLAHCIHELLEGRSADGERPRALLVEDDALLRDLTARMLEQMQFAVSEAESVDAALRLIDGGQRFDFALVDRLLGDGDGIAVAAALRRRQPPTPVLLTSGYGEHEPGDDEALVETLRKPYGYDALADAIARLGVRIDGLRPVPP